LNLFLFTEKFLEALEEYSIPKQEWGWGLINMKNSRPLPLGSREVAPSS